MRVQNVDIKFDDRYRLYRPKSELSFLSFTNVVDSVRQEAARLKDEGVEMLIALGHYGYAEDMAMAQQVIIVEVE